MKKSTSASVTTITGRVSLEGVRTVFQADGVTVAEQKAILKLEKGIFSKRFWLPLGVLQVAQLNNVLAKGSRDNLPVTLEMSLQDVTKVDGRFRTYHANLQSVSVPLTDESLIALKASQTLVSGKERSVK